MSLPTNVESHGVHFNSTCLRKRGRGCLSNSELMPQGELKQETRLHGFLSALVPLRVVSIFPSMVHVTLVFKNLGCLKTPGFCKQTALGASIEDAWARPGCPQPGCQSQ